MTSISVVFAIGLLVGFAVGYAVRAATTSSAALSYISVEPHFLPHACERWRSRRAATPLAKQFGSIVRRGGQVLIVFNRDEPMVDTLDQDLGPRPNRLLDKNFRVEMIDGADHVFVPVWSQRRLADMICEYIERDVARLSDPD